MTDAATTRDGALTVMIVDDHPLVRAAVRGAISAADVHVVGEAATAEEALDLAPRLQPRILLLDIEMPGMSGVQLVRELAPRLPHTRIIMLTVSAADRDVLDAIRNGATGYLTKDVTPESLARSVRAAETDQLVMPRVLAARLVHRLVHRGGDAVSPDAQPGHDGLGALTRRERDIVRLIAEGLTDREIATALTISTRTVETHVSSVLHKLGARNRFEAAARYREP
jgi:DNA-binding NarL/FixJ family response regulator